MKDSALNDDQKTSDKRLASRKLIADKLAIESELVAKDSMKVLTEFETSVDIE